MTIPNELISKAKEKLGVEAAQIIAKGMKIQKWDRSKLKGCCPMHHEKNSSFIWNKKGNYFKCFGCNITFDIIDYYMQCEGLNFIQACERLFKEVCENYDFEFEQVTQHKKAYKYPMLEKNQNKDKVEQYLKLRGINKETLNYPDVKQDFKGNIVFDYRDQYGELLLVKYRPSRKIKEGENKSWCQKNADTTPILYGMDKVNTTKPLLICEGEIDRLAALESGFKNVVSVPFGAGNFKWVEHNWEWLEQFEKIIIWSDNDKMGEKMRTQVIPRLGEWRCSYVLSPFKDINIHLIKEGKDSVLEVINNAKEVPISNVVDMANVEEFDINNAEKISSGFSRLDKFISGFVLGTVDVITGYNSSGKSTLVNQMCVCEPLNQGYKTFIFSGELSKSILRSWIEFPLAGCSNIKEINNGLNKPKGYYVSKEIKEKMRKWYEGKIFFYDNDEDYSANSILYKMREMARRYGVKNFVLDNFLMIDLKCQEDEKYTKQKEFIQSLVTFAKQYQVVIHLIAHPRKTQRMQQLTKMDIAGSGDITNLVDYVLSVYRVTNKEKEYEINKKGQRVAKGCKYDTLLELFKNRLLGHQDKTIGLHFDISSKRFYGDSDNLYKKYGWDD